MIKRLLTLLVFIILLSNCEESNPVPEKESEYPTIIKKINEDKLSRMRLEFFRNNIYLITSLNEFGFCSFTWEGNLFPNPPVSRRNISLESEAVEVVKNFVNRNALYTGVKNPDELTFTGIHSSSESDGTIYWYLETDNQKIDSLEVLDTKIGFKIRRKEMFICEGNWFPEIYIPPQFNINRIKVKELLADKVVEYIIISGQHVFVYISSEDLNKSTIRPVILPITTENQITLYITWQIDITDPVNYLIFIDVMTGEIVNMVKKKIS